VDNATLDVCVARRTLEAASICSFELVPVNGEPLPAFSAGAHIDVYLPNGLVRQYSLCNAPLAGERYQVAVLLDPCTRGGSKAMHEMVQEGDVIRIGAPRNNFPLTAGAKRSLLFAGGIGITPLLSMAEALTAEGKDFTLHYCARSPESAAFRDRIARSPFQDRAVFHYDDSAAEQRFDAPAIFANTSPETHVYVCGPQGFMDHVLAGARAARWPEACLHHESFDPVAQTLAGDSAFEVELARSGRTVAVPADRSVVQALEEAGIDIVVSCEQGLCGTCLTGVIAGVPEHRDSYLSAEQRASNTLFTPCCSRAQTPRLVLDL
jgi:vanillate O-demethylase ferredoxin subunit